MNTSDFIQISKGFYIDKKYKAAFERLGLTSIDSVFAFEAGKNLSKPTLARHRSRIQLELDDPKTTLFIKRYDHPPIFLQIIEWLSRRRITSTIFNDLETAEKLSASGINTPKTAACGSRWGFIFERRSFIVTKKVEGESLERSLPQYFKDISQEALKDRRHFIKALALFAADFHKTGFRHRDFYFSHIFYSDSGTFSLIDLQRVFKPLSFSKKYLIKDLAQLSYSAPAQYFSKTDRIRFYHAYAHKDYLEKNDKSLIRCILQKMNAMARHDRKHNRPIPFES